MVNVAYSLLWLVLLLLCPFCLSGPVQEWPKKTAVGTTIVKGFQNLENSERLGLSKPDVKSDNNPQSKEFSRKNQTADGNVHIPVEAAELYSQTVTDMTHFLKESNAKFRQIQLHSRASSASENATNEIDRSDYVSLPVAGSFSPLHFFMDDNPNSRFNKFFSGLLHDWMRYEVNNAEKLRRSVEVLRAVFWPINKLVVIGNRILTYRADQNQIKDRASNDTYQIDFVKILELILEQLTVLLEPNNEFPLLE